MFCSRESTNCLIIQQDEKSTEIYIRPIGDGSSVPIMGLGEMSVKGQ